MNILVLATNYTVPDEVVASHFIHSRNKWYLESDMKVDVLSFSAKSDYVVENINVYTYETYKNNLINKNYDILLSHAPNLRNHYRFLKKHGERFDNIIFFFHGHEVLITSEIYPKPYDCTKNKLLISRIVRKAYDKFKLIVWKKYFEENAYKSQFVFVSNWMYKKFTKYVKINSKIIENRKHIIYNCIGKSFESNMYDKSFDKNYDFITIRNMLDKSKYGIDIVTRIAQNNPQYKFCVVGKGEFYKYNKKPNNLEWINKNLTHEEIIDFLNKSKCALLPTRADAQGVMACEMATFGIPLITSNIDVCKEVFEGFKNVAFIDNNEENIDVRPILKELESLEKEEKNKKYFAENTVGEEIKLFKRVKG